MLNRPLNKGVINRVVFGARFLTRSPSIAVLGWPSRDRAKVSNFWLCQNSILLSQDLGSHWKSSETVSPTCHPRHSYVGPSACEKITKLETCCGFHSIRHRTTTKLYDSLNLFYFLKCFFSLARDVTRRAPEGLIKCKVLFASASNWIKNSPARHSLTNPFPEKHHEPFSACLQEGNFNPLRNSHKNKLINRTRELLQRERKKSTSHRLLEERIFSLKIHFKI